jgi:hypothetical protein
MAFGISGGGRKAEELYRAVTGADPAPRAADGDAVLEGNLVEVKRLYALKWGARVRMCGGEGRRGQVTPPVWRSTLSR